MDVVQDRNRPLDVLEGDRDAVPFVQHSGLADGAHWQRGKPIERLARIGQELAARGLERDGVKDRQRDSRHRISWNDEAASRPWRYYGSTHSNVGVQMTTVSVLLIATLAAAGQAQAPPPKITMVTVEGCASGLLLKSARPSTIEEAELIVSPVYKMTGSKAIKAEIRKLNGMQVRVRAELPELP